MSHLSLTSFRKTRHEALVREVAQALSEGTLCPSDVAGLSDRQVRAWMGVRSRHTRR